MVLKTISPGCVVRASPMLFFDRKIMLVCYCKNCEIYWITVMASPGQRRGSCGHIMAGFDAHDKCTR